MVQALTAPEVIKSVDIDISPLTDIANTESPESNLDIFPPTEIDPEQI